MERRRREMDSMAAERRMAHRCWVMREEEEDKSIEEGEEEGIEG